MAKRKRPKAQQPRAAAQAANSRRRKRRRTGKKTIHYILLVVFVLAAGVVLSLTTFFQIEEVRVVSADKQYALKYPVEELVEASGIEAGENLFRVKLSHIADELVVKYPYIESAKVNRKLPPAIEITVTQATPEAAVLEDEVVVFITRDGKVLERGKILIPEGVPIVKGIDTAGVPEGEMLGEESVNSLKSLNYLLQAIEANELEGITNMDISDPLNIRIVYENRMLLKLGTEADMEHKLNFTYRVMLMQEPNWQGRIDASNARSRKEVVVKPMELAEALALEDKSLWEEEIVAGDGEVGEDTNLEIDGNEQELQQEV